MGRVFTTEQMVDGQIPTLQDFANAVEAFDAAIELCVEEGTVLGGAVFGSSLTHPTPRSDIDAIVVRSDGPHNLHDSRFITDSVYRAGRCRVPTGIVSKTAAELQAGRHEMDRFFVQGQLSKNRQTTGKDPAHFILCRPTAADTIFLGYVDSKKRKLTEGWDTRDQLDEQAVCRQVQRLLELPVSISRKLIPSLVELRADIAPIEDSANKVGILDTALPILRQFDLDDYAHSLLAHDRAYTKFVETTRGRNISPTQYKKHIDQLFDMTPDATFWLDALEVRFAEYVGSLSLTPQLAVVPSDRHHQRPA